MDKDQQSRVEAARKFWASAMTERDQDVFEDAIDDEHGAWFMPDGSDSGWGNGRMRAVDAWKEWAKAAADRRAAERRAAPGNDAEVECNSCGATFALAARWAHVCPLPDRYAGRESAPTPPLAEMFRFRPVAVLHNGLGCSALVADGVSDAQARQVWADGVDSGRYKLGGYRIWLTAVCGWVHVLEEHDTVLRAEEAESKVAEVVPAPVAPVAPAMTLDAMRDALVAAGATVVMPKVGGFYNAPGALHALDALAVLCADDREALRAGGCWSGGNAPERIAKGLRALGVTPAVLS
jgi:hypothetical protein